MTRPVDPAALETLALTLHAEDGRLRHPLDLKAPAWTKLAPHHRQSWRDEALKLIAEQTPAVKVEPAADEVPEGQRLLTRFELACLALFEGLHPESTSPDPPHKMRIDDTVIATKAFRLSGSKVKKALEMADKRNIKLRSLFGSDDYIDRSGDLRK